MKQLLPPVVGERGARTREEEGRGGLAPPGMLLRVWLPAPTWLTWLVLWFEAGARQTGPQDHSQSLKFLSTWTEVLGFALPTLRGTVQIRMPLPGNCEMSARGARLAL